MRSLPPPPPTATPPLSPRSAGTAASFLPAAASVVVHGVAVLALLGGGLRAGVVAPPALRPESNPNSVATGDTFDLPTDVVDESAPGAAGSQGAEPPPVPPPAEAPAVDTGEPGAGARAPAPRPTRATRQGASARTPQPASTPESAGAAGAAGETGPEGAGEGAPRFGAVGDRSAVELTTAFTRGFPQAASADPSWAAAPLGPAGTVDVDLTLDDAGALVASRATGSPSPALREGLRRTLALLRARTFVAASKQTRLRVTATVTRDEVHDGLHGEVFAIGGGFAGGEGSGFFALAIGRRVDVRVRVVR